MGVTDTVFGTPPQTQIMQTPAMKPPGYSWARDFFNSLGGVANSPFPTYQGQLDPGLSPTMAMLLRNAQGYSQAGPPEIMAGVQGSLGRFMNPSFQNPQTRIPMGVSDYMGQNPNQRIFGGQTVNNMGNAFGAIGARGPDMTPKPFGGGPSTPSFGSFGAPPTPPPGMAKGGMMPGYQPLDPNNPAAGGHQMWNATMGGYPRMPGGYGMPGGSGGTATGNNLSNDMLGAWGPAMNGWDPTANTLPTTWTGGPEGPRPRGGVTDVPWTGQMPPSGIAGGLRNTMFGGYTGDQLRLDPSLVQRLGGHAMERWNAQNPSAQAAPPAWMQLHDLGIGGQGSAAANRTLAGSLAGIPHWFTSLHNARGTNPQDLPGLWQARLGRLGQAPPTAPPPPTGDTWTS